MENLYYTSKVSNSKGLNCPQLTTRSSIPCPFQGQHSVVSHYTNHPSIGTEQEKAKLSFEGWYASNQ